MSLGQERQEQQRLDAVTSTRLTRSISGPTASELRSLSLIHALQLSLPVGPVKMRLAQKPASFYHHDPPQQVLDALWSLGPAQPISPDAGHHSVAFLHQHTDPESFAAAMGQICSPALFPIMMKHLSHQGIINLALAINAPAKLRMGPLRDHNVSVQINQINHREWLEAMASSLHAPERMLDFLAFLPEERQSVRAGIGRGSGAMGKAIRSRARGFDSVRDLCRQEVHRVWYAEYLNSCSAEDREMLKVNGERLGLTLTSSALRSAVDNDNPALINRILMSTDKMKGRELIQAFDCAVRTNRTMTAMHLADLIMRDTNATRMDKCDLERCLNSFSHDRVTLPSPSLHEMLRAYTTTGSARPMFDEHGRPLEWTVNGPWLCQRPSTLTPDMQSIVHQSF